MSPSAYPGRACEKFERPSKILRAKPPSLVEVFWSKRGSFTVTRSRSRSSLVLEIKPSHACPKESALLPDRQSRYSASLPQSWAQVAIVINSNALRKAVTERRYETVKT